MTEVQAPLRAAAEWGPPQSSNLDANDLMAESAAPANTSAAMTMQAPLQSQGAVLVRPKPVRVPPHLVRPVPVRPVPVKPQQRLPAISQQDAAQFYAQAHAQGVPAQAVHQAVVASHEWHRKWTHQETVGHFIQESKADTSNESSPQLPLKLPEHYAFDRMAGAKNPSPEQEDPMEVPQQQQQQPQQRKRHLIPDEDEESETERDEEETDSQEEGEEDLLQPLKRRLERTSLPAGQPTAMAAPIVPLAVRPVPQRPVLPQLVRPVALRIAAAADQIVDLPHDIPRGFRTQQLSVSPLTVPSGCGSSRKSRNSRSQRSGGAYAQHHPQYPHQPPSTAQHAYAQQQSHWIPEHDDDEALLLQDRVTVPAEISHPARSPVWSRPVRHARDGLLHALAISGGQVESEAFTASLGLLRQAYANAGLDTCLPESAMSEGTWLTLTKPTFFACLGENDNGDPMYQLGRMAFDMFSPTTTVCSLQGNFNVVERVSHVEELACVPKSLQEEVAAGTSVLRTYNIATAFTIEPSLAAYPNAPNKDVHRPIRGIMTTQGYCLADPEEPNRHSVWITGGKIEPNDNALDQQDWHRLFSRHPPKHSMTEKAKLLAVQLLMGATLPQSVDAQTGAMEYQFTRPLGGHGFAYVDTLYVDQTLRIVQGHRGTIFVFLRQSP